MPKCADHCATSSSAVYSVFCESRTASPPNPPNFEFGSDQLESPPQPPYFENVTQPKPPHKNVHLEDNELARYQCRGHHVEQIGQRNILTHPLPVITRQNEIREPKSLTKGYRPNEKREQSSLPNDAGTSVALRSNALFEQQFANTQRFCKHARNNESLILRTRRDSTKKPEELRGMMRNLMVKPETLINTDESLLVPDHPVVRPAPRHDHATDSSTETTVTNMR